MKLDAWGRKDLAKGLWQMFAMLSPLITIRFSKRYIIVIVALPPDAEPLDTEDVRRMKVTDWNLYAEE